MQAQNYIKGKYDSEKKIFITKNTSYWIDFFQGNVARISAYGLFGLIDKKGKILCAPKYDLIYDFQNGLAITNIGEKFGIISAKGKELIVPQYENLAFLKDDIFVAQKENKYDYGLIRSNGDILIEIKTNTAFKLNKDSNIVYCDAGEIGFINEKTWSKIPVFKKAPLLSSNIIDGNMSIRYGFDSSLLWLISTVIDMTHRSPYYYTITINPILEYNNNLTINFECVDSICLFGFMDRKLKPIIKAEYTWVNAFKNGYASVFKNEKCGVIDTSGNIILPIEFDYIELLDNNHFIVKKEEKYGVIDKNNQIIIPIKYETIRYAENDLYAIYNGEKWGVINGKEELILPYEYDGIANNLAIKISKISTFPEPTASIHNNVYFEGYYFDKNGLLDKDFIPMMKYFYNIVDFNVGSANFKSYTITKYPDSSKYDISVPINEQFNIIGKHIGDCKGGNMYDISQCFLKGIMNTNNELVIPLLYDDIKQSKINKQKAKIQTFVISNHLNYLADLRDWKSAYLKENNILPEYSSNLFIVTSPNCKYGVIDINHKMILEPEYDYIAIEKGKIIAYKYLKESKDNAVTMTGKCFHKTYLEQESAIFDFTGKMIEPFKKLEKR